MLLNTKYFALLIKSLYLKVVYIVLSAALITSNKKEFTSILFIYNLFAPLQTKKVQITRTIKSADEKEVFESATVHAERLKNSSINAHKITNTKGDFKLMPIPRILK